MLVLIITIASIALVVFALLSLLLFVKTRRFVLATVLALLSVFLLLADIKLAQFRKMTASRPTMPPTTVTSAEEKKADWQPMRTAAGSISPVPGAVIRGEVRVTG